MAEIDLDGHVERQPDGSWTVTVTVTGLLTEREAVSVCEGLRAPTVEAVCRLGNIKILEASDLN